MIGGPGSVREDGRIVRSLILGVEGNQNLSVIGGVERKRGDVRTPILLFIMVDKLFVWFIATQELMWVNLIGYVT
jgi:hypothetical protein